jgi:hypothetical protein
LRFHGFSITGELNDDNAVYHEPPPSEVTFRGKWKNGKMAAAEQFDSNGNPYRHPDIPNDIQYSISNQRTRRKSQAPGVKADGRVVFADDEATFEILNTLPLVPCVFESERVYVSNSNTPAAGEGLFAKIDIGTGEVCAFYNGIKVGRFFIGLEFSLFTCLLVYLLIVR